MFSLCHPEKARISIPEQMDLDPHASSAAVTPLTSLGLSGRNDKSNSSTVTRSQEHCDNENT